MRRFILFFSFIAVLLGCSNCGPGKTASTDTVPSSGEKSTVYFTSEITPESLVKIYDALGVEAFGRVAVKISTGESPESSHLQNYDFMINLAHFKGHAMGGFGGVLKNQSIGVASSAGKVYIHTAGKRTSGAIFGTNSQDSFLESMAAAAQAVHNYFKAEGKDIVYINVMNNMSVDCDCDGHPAAPEMKDIGILASKDPVALDKACLDLVFSHKDSAGDDAKALQQRINSRHGTHIVDYAASIGLGNLGYEIVNIDL